MKQELFLKVCGMKDIANIGRLVTEVVPDYLGLIFYEKSPRYAGSVDPGHLEMLGKVKKVGVFVNADLNLMLRTAEKFSLATIQLHGDEPVSLVRQVIDAGYETFKVFRIKDSEDLKSLHEYEETADYFLFDTKGVNYGGNGERFDWNVLHDYQGKTPVILSGGIDENSLDDIEAFKHLPIAGVDINSRFEDSPGVKSIEKIKRFKNRYNDIFKPER